MKLATPHRRYSSYSSASSSVVRPLRFVGDDSDLVAALRARHPGATDALYERFGDHVLRVLARIIGVDAELPELLHDTFIEAFSGIGSVKDGTRLKAWVTSVAVYTARGCLRRRRRRRWLKFWDPEDVPEQEVQTTDVEAREALRATYAVLDELPIELRIAFALRFIDGMEIAEVAEVLNVSMSTAKRRLVRAEARFAVHAEKYPEIAEWRSDHRGGKNR